MTDEQLNALYPDRMKKAFFEVQDTVTDVVTGEILTTTRKTVSKVSSEPDFIKLYYKTMLAFNDIDNIPLDFILSISGFMNYSNDGDPIIFTNNKLVKEIVCKNCGIKDSMYAKYVKRCVESGLLIPTKNYKGVYEVNPFFIAKGKWDSIKQLQTTYDFINGKWMKLETVDDDKQ